MITAYITHPDCHLHHMGPEHPESPLRLDAIRARLMLSGVLQQTMQSEAREATEEQLARVHPLRHLRALHRRGVVPGRVVDAAALRARCPAGSPRSS